MTFNMQESFLLAIWSQRNTR